MHNHEVFKIKIEDKLLVTVPTLGQTFLADSKKASEIPDVIVSEHPMPWERTSPELLIVMVLTDDCNLACKYCYERRLSRKKSSIIMNEQMINRIMEYIIFQWRTARYSKIKVAFFGGEPTLHSMILKHAIDMTHATASYLGISIYKSITTNGNYTADIGDYLALNMDSVTFSIDGIKSIHDFHRPTKRMAGSFDRLFKNIERYSVCGKDMGFRVTVTEQSASSMNDTVAMLGLRFPKSKIHFEPVMSHNDMSLDIDLFIDRLLETMEYAEALHVKCSSSVLRNSIKPYFCDLSNRLTVFPDGHLSACHRMDPRDESALLFKKFIYGNIGEDFEVINEHMRTAGIDLSVFNKSECSGCFLKFTCSGGCYANILTNEDSPRWCNSVQNGYLKLYKKQLGGKQ